MNAELTTADGLASAATASRTMSLASVMEGDIPRHLTSGGRSEGRAPVAINRMRERVAHRSAKEVAKAREESRNRLFKSLAARMGADSLLLEDTYMDRVEAAYRIINAMARVSGDLSGPGLLAALPPDWTTPVERNLSQGMTQGVLPARRSLEAMSVAGGYSHVSENGICNTRGVSYLPPPIPDRYFEGLEPHLIIQLRKSGFVPQGYDPAEDEALNLWIDAAEYLAYFYSVTEGTKEFPERGFRSTAGLFSAKTARLCWPTRDDILNYEQELMFHLIDVIGRRRMSGGGAVSVSTMKYLEETMGLTGAEAVMCLKAAGIYEAAISAEPIELQRARSVGRMAVVADRAIDSGDVRAEIAALKHRDQLLGLTRHDDSEEVEAFRDLADRALGAPEEEDGETFP